MVHGLIDATIYMTAFNLFRIIYRRRVNHHQMKTFQNPYRHLMLTKFITHGKKLYKGAKTTLKAQLQQPEHYYKPFASIS